MDRKLIEYLNKVDHYLKPMNSNDRTDIVKEIESEIIELQNAGIETGKILERLGKPKDLAVAYLSDSIVSGKLNFQKLGTLVAFYSLTGIAGLFVLPVTSISAIAFMASGIAMPIAGIIKFVAHLVGIEIPQIGITFGSFTVEAVAVLPISILLGVLTFGVGFLAWKLTIAIVKGIGKSRRTICFSGLDR